MPRLLTLDDVKPLLGNLSRDNYYQVQFGGLQLDLQNYLTSRGVGSFFTADDMGLLCYQAQLPGASLAGTESTNFHGVTETFAHRRIYTPLSLNFYCDDEYRALKFLEHWMEYSISGNGTNGANGYFNKNYSYRMQYPDLYKSGSTKIFKFEKNFTRFMEYSFYGLFPINLSSVPVAYSDRSDITRVTCEFRYDRYIAGSALSSDIFRGTSNNISSSLRSVNNVLNTVNNVVNTADNIIGLFTN